MEHGASPDCRDNEKMTPLTRAVEKGSKNTATFLFDDGQRLLLLFAIDRLGGSLID